MHTGNRTGFQPIKKLAPLPWQAAVVDRMVHVHEIDKTDSRKACWKARFALTRMHDRGETAEAAAAWMARGFEVP